MADQVALYHSAAMACGLAVRMNRWECPSHALAAAFVASQGRLVRVLVKWGRIVVSMQRRFRIVFNTWPRMVAFTQFAACHRESVLAVQQAAFLSRR